MLAFDVALAVFGDLVGVLEAGEAEGESVAMAAFDGVDFPLD